MTHKHAKACPFCGEDIGPVVARQGTKYTFYQVMHQPNKKGHRHGLIIMDVDAWNTRPIEDELRRQIAELSWKSVGYTLPEDGEIVLTLSRDGDIKKMRYYEGRGWYSGFMQSLPYVTHWMHVHMPDQEVEE